MTESCDALEEISCSTGEQRAPVKVLFLLDDTERGALTARLGAILARLQRMQVRALVVCIDDYGDGTEQIQAKAVAVVSLEAPRSGRSSVVENLGALMRMKGIIKRAEPDMVQAWGPRAERMGRVVCAGLGLPFLVTGSPAAPGGCGRRLADLALRLFFPEPPRLLADADEASLLYETRTRRGPLRLIGAGVDISRARSAIASGLEELPLDHYYVGLPLRPGQGATLRRMLDAFRPIAALRDDARLVVMADPATVELRPWVTDLGLDGRVLVRALPDEPAGLIRRMNVLWAHDRPKPDQDMMLRAMALGVPVVCDHDTGLAQDIREIGGALMRDAAWPRQFAEATRELIENPELATAVGQGGRALVEQRHGIEIQADGMRAVYDELLAARSRP